MKRLRRFCLVAGTCDHDGLNDCITSVRVSRQ